mmetsp:Transcript_39219/g.76707  ORF Transcript_39219/g.76707 Transcript_39219/m.76707 type:complete len:88 (-) Transcript_39219:171-434(-)
MNHDDCAEDADKSPAHNISKTLIDTYRYKTMMTMMMIPSLSHYGDYAEDAAATGTAWTTGVASATAACGVYSPMRSMKVTSFSCSDA